MHLAVDEEADPDGRETEAIGEPELVGERDHALVGGDDHVVEAIDSMPTEVKRPGKAAGGGGALEQRDARAAFGKAQRQHGAEDAGADDPDMRRPHRPPGTRKRRTQGTSVLCTATERRSSAAGHRPPAIARSCAVGRSSARAASSSLPSGEIGGGWMRPTRWAAISRP